MTRMLRSDEVMVEVCPEEGGRVSSLRCAQSGTEFLTQARPGRTAVEPGYEAQFADGACGGIEDCLPSVGACGPETEGGRVPDHGDFWQVAWTEGERTESSVLMEAQGFSRPLLLQKEMQVEGRTLLVRYRVSNHGDAAVSLLYAAHPLLAIARGDRIVLPSEVRELAVHYARGVLADAAETRLAWPCAGGNGDETDLSVTGGVEDGAAMMLYTDRLAHGACGLYRSRERQGVALRFEVEALPYLGVWLCYGGWPDRADLPRQYAVALEPTHAPVGRLDAAQRAGQAMLLEPGAAATWRIRFELTPPETSLDAFCQAIARSTGNGLA